VASWTSVTSPLLFTHYLSLAPSLIVNHSLFLLQEWVNPMLASWSARSFITHSVSYTVL
jgi:hypothetical protein